VDAFTGKTIRGCDFRERIGVGGYGWVYRAYEASLDREVAIKVIHPERANNPEFKARFESEARMIARLQHPHIVPLHAFWQDDDGTFLMMRLLKCSLRDVLKKRKALSLVETARWLDPIADALAFAHEQGIIHCDLKPNNILLDERGNPYLTDFGIAHDVNAPIEVNTGEGMLGSPAYLSPEQIRFRELSERSDIYSLGISLYEVLAGAHPFAGLPISTMIARHVNDRLPPLRTFRDDLPPAVDIIIQKATAKSPDDRYQTVTELAADFRAAARLRTISAWTRETPVEELTEEVTGYAPTEANIPAITPSDPTPPPPVLADTGDRNRWNMLRNVQTFWITGVLENALGGAELIQPDMEDRLGDPRWVSHPWNSLLKRYDRHDDEPLPRGTPILDIFDRMNGKLLILGDPGGGKTTTLLELARGLLRRAERDGQHPIPVVFNLSSWSAGHDTLEKWLAEELNAKYQVPRPVAETWVRDDKLTLLLDGLDEVAQSEREMCVKAINTYRQSHGFVDIVICSRTEDYEALSTRLLLNGAVIIQPLDDTQIEAYLDGFGAETATLRRTLMSDHELHELARSPLMLNVMAQAYQGDTSSGLIPSGDNIRRGLFDQYTRRMFIRKGNETTYTPEQTGRYLSWLASRMGEHGQSLFLIERMQPDWLTPDQRRRYYRNLRLYHMLAWGGGWGILLTVVLSLLGIPGGPLWGLLFGLGGAVAGWLLGGTEWRRWWAAPLVGLLLAIPTGWNSNYGRDSETILRAVAVAAVTFTVIIAVCQFMLRQNKYSRDHIASVDQLRFNWRAVNPWMGVVGLVSGLLLSVFNMTRPDAPSTLASILVGVTVAVFLMLLSGMRGDRVATTTRPNEGIRRSAGNALRFGLLVGVLALILSVLVLPNPVEGLLYGLVNSITLGYAIWLAYGGFAVVQHWLLRRVLETDGAIPRNYAAFLDTAVRLIFLRGVGGGYIFVHRYLLEYFAEGEGT
jgi:DNA polymerase III delta prime subunit